jgi:hypothetical protein
VSVHGSRGGTGHRAETIVFTNGRQASCTITGWPGVSYVAGDDGHQVGAAAGRDGTMGSPVTLAPGQSASARVNEVNAHDYPAGKCHPANVRGLRIYPPNNTASAYVARPGTGCANPHVDQLGVRAVAPDTDG